ncbi:SET domain-containing protein 5 [Cyphellophora attinorum]|uniref:SET domain-containing protein 5 n=1 Tax=Cyphellophora attinorum TaxID=1664694 RepID=A0A0N1HR21_9EURO|nr:SET domain-containing protein 5 [Phialophora attinorum]KPI38103.1 SET domain-containing protein 5 [Phialophora attinorum]
MKVLRFVIAVAVSSCSVSASKVQQLRSVPGICTVISNSRPTWPICATNLRDDDGSSIGGVQDHSENQSDRHGHDTGTKFGLPYEKPADYSNDDPSCTGHLDHIDDKLCVYIHPAFEKGRGISAFTTPSIAREFEKRISAIARERDGRRNASGTLSEITMHPSLEVTALSNKGMGVVATSLIPAGTRLLHSSPVLLVHNIESPRAFEREFHLRTAVAKLPPATRDAFNNLAKSYNNPAVHAQDIIKTNAFAIDVSSVQHLAVFPEASRFNHDCAPNAMYYLDNIGLTHTLHATREIAEGEEVTVSYVDPISPAWFRKSELLQAFGFTCSCHRCANAEEDDALLAEAKLLEAELGDWESDTSDTDSWAYTQKAKRLIELYQTLKLEGFINTAYGHAALTYNSLGDSGKATMYARKALEAAKLRHGPAELGSRAVTVWEEFLEEGAWAHWSWNRRRED